MSLNTNYSGTVLYGNLVSHTLNYVAVSDYRWPQAQFYLIGKVKQTVAYQVTLSRNLSASSQSE